MSSDSLHRLMLPKLNLRAYTVSTLDTAREICTAHQTTPNATSALGKGINAAALLSATLKPDSDQNLTFRVQGSGPLRDCLVQADAHGNMRGYVANPRIDENAQLNAISFPKAIGAGLLTVTKDLGMKEPYTGVTHLVKGELAIDTAYYLTTSEQIPSAVVLALTLDRSGAISSSGGILIQSLPDTPEKSISLVESKLASPHEKLCDALMRGDSAVSYLKTLLDDTAIETIGITPIRHRCRCSHELLKGVIAAIDRDELEDMIVKDGGAAIHCTFCNKEYRFDAQEIRTIIDADK